MQHHRRVWIIQCILMGAAALTASLAGCRSEATQAAPPDAAAGPAATTPDGSETADTPPPKAAQPAAPEGSDEPDDAETPRPPDKPDDAKPPRPNRPRQRSDEPLLEARKTEMAANSEYRIMNKEYRSKRPAARGARRRVGLLRDSVVPVR